MDKNRIKIKFGVDIEARQYALGMGNVCTEYYSDYYLALAGA